MARKSPAARSEARKDYEHAAAEHAAGEGSRFKALKKAVAAGGARNPGAVAASIGRKKFGKKKFQKMASEGRKHG